MLSIRKSKSYLFDLIIIGVLLGVFYALWIGGHALFTPDEGRYSEVAREMVVSGDFITPRLDGVPFLDKPVLYYWLQASAIKLFGLKEWALRFWPALIGIFGCLITYVVGRKFFNRRTGLLAAIILSTSPLYYGAAHYANLDLEVAVLISSALYFFMWALHSSFPQRKFLLLFAYIFCGLAALTKGLIGIVFPAMIVGLWILLLNRWNQIKHLRLITGLIIFFAITIPWYYLVQQANPEFLHFFFVTQQVSRFLTQGDYNNQTVFWFYIPVIFIGFFPWSLFLIQAITKNIKTIWQRGQQYSVELFLLIWFVMIFTFFSIPKSKTVGYIIPIFPALALFVGHYLDGILDGVSTKSFRLSVNAFILVSLMIFAGSLFAFYKLPASSFPYLILIACLFVLATLTNFILLKRNQVTKIIYCFFAVAILGLLTLSSSTSIMNEKSVKPIAQMLKPKLTPSDEIVAYNKYYQDLPIYFERRITIVADWNAPGIVNRDNWLRELWYGKSFQNTQDWLINENTFWQRWNSDKRLYVVMSENDYAKFMVKAKNGAQEIWKHSDIVWVSNR